MTIMKPLSTRTQSIEFVVAPPTATTSDGKPITWWVDKQVEDGTWRMEVIPAMLLASLDQ